MIKQQLIDFVIFMVFYTLLDFLSNFQSLIFHAWTVSIMIIGVDHLINFKQRWGEVTTPYITQAMLPV